MFCQSVSQRQLIDVSELCTAHCFYSAQVMLQFESLRSEIWHSIDASQTPDNVASEVTAAVTSMIEQGGRTALCNTLW
jgi:hypothetical protein